MINSALVTAQNRKRNYWSNWDISQPEDKGILLKDIIEGGTVDRDKSLCITTRIAGATAKRYLEKSQHQMVIERPCELRDTPPAESALCHHVATATDIKANEANKRVYADTGKSPTVTTMGGGHREPKVLVGRVVGRKINPETGKRDDYNPDLKIVQRLEPRPDEKSGCITTVQKDNVLITEHPKYRKLTPKECMRLQGFTEEIIDKLLNAGISNSQLYKMTGNSFTLPVIIHNIQCLLDTGWMEE
jgi:site-specific DNA-cytosine methylase